MAKMLPPLDGQWTKSTNFHFIIWSVGKKEDKAKALTLLPPKIRFSAGKKCFERFHCQVSDIRENMSQCLRMDRHMFFCWKVFLFIFSCFTPRNLFKLPSLSKVFFSVFPITLYSNQVWQEKSPQTTLSIFALMIHFWVPLEFNKSNLIENTFSLTYFH